jgi:hypothetical protein
VSVCVFFIVIPVVLPMIMINGLKIRCVKKSGAWYFGIDGLQ